MSSWPAGSFWLCCFWQVARHLWSCTYPGSPVTCTSTLVEMSTWPAGSFCLCCFWQVVRHLWSLQVSGIRHHTYLHPSSNVFLTSWFILAVLFLTGGEMSVVLHISRIPCYMHLHPCRNVYLKSWFILSVLFLTGNEMFLVPASVRVPPSHRPPP